MKISKKLISFLLIATTLVCTLPLNTFALDINSETSVNEDSAVQTNYNMPEDAKSNNSEQTTSIGLTYTLNNNKSAYIVSGIGTCTDSTIVIPSAYNGLPVTTINYDAFNNCASLTSIKIPDSVTTIGARAFRMCSSLTNIEIPNSVTFIGEYAFSGCSSLVSIELPNSITTFEGYVFLNCSSLKEIVLPENITKITGRMFDGCSSLVSIEIPDSVTVIDSYAFLDCTSMVSVVLSNSLIQIGYGAFHGCILLNNVIIPGNTTTIDRYAFQDCRSLTNITIPKSVTQILYSAFYACGSLSDVYYDGTAEDWNKISIASSNENLKNANIHYCQQQIPDDAMDKSFLDEHLSFATNEKISALVKQNGFHSFGKINKWNLFWYNTYDVVGDVFDVCTFNFGDLSISANYYEMYLADMILALNGANSLGYLENKIFQSLSEIYSGLESALQTDAEWLDSANSSFVDEIKDISIGKANTISEGAKDFLQKHLNKLYKNNKSKITSIFANLSDASKFVDAFFLAEDVANAFIDAIKAYAVSKAFYEVNDEFFNVCIEAGNLMKSEGSAKHGRWFLDAVYKAQNSELGKFDAIFDGFYTWALPATDILYQTVMPEFIKGYVYNSVSNVLGATVGKVSAAFTIGNAAYDLLDIITDGNEESKQYNLIHYILSVEKQLNAVVDLRKERLLSSPLETNAISYDVAYKVLRQTNMYLCDATYKYASLRNNSNDMSACISFKNWWNQTLCHSGNYDGKYNLFSAHCPVDVYIYDLNGVLVTSVVDEKIIEHDTRITVTIGNGHKSFAYSSDEEFTFVIKAREEGEMDYSFSQLNDTEIENKYVSYNIPLEVEQEFSVTIPTSTASGDDFKLNTNETQVDFDYESTNSCEKHSFGEWVINEEKHSRTCTVCGYVEYKTVCTHNHEALEVYSTVPTCTNPGHTIFICSFCGTQISDGVDVEPKHTPAENPVITEPTCTDEGYTTYTCLECDNTYTAEATLPLGHSGGVATCQEQATCTICGELYGELNKHTYGEWVITKEATESENGLKEKTCACGDKITEVIPKLENVLSQGPSANVDASLDTFNDNDSMSLWNKISILFINIYEFLVKVFNDFLNLFDF